MVNTESIKIAIIDREEELKKKFENETIILREGMDKIVPLTDVALIITGARRTGKSICAVMLGKKEQSAYVNFDDERLTMEAKDLNKVLEAIYSLKKEVSLIILDEIQNVVGWEKFVSRIMQTKKIIITGSNARLLSKELSTHLTGRHVNFVLFPFSFREFLTFRRIKINLYSTKDISKCKILLKEYLEIGGFPLASKLGRNFLSENYKDIIERDVIQRYTVRNSSFIKELALYLISNSSKEISFNKLKNIFGAKSTNTVRKYASYLENTYLFFFLNRFSFKLKEQSIAPKKVYCIDTGLINSIGFRVSENMGRIMENAVAIELMRRISRNGKSELYYWKDHQQREVDFIIKKGKNITELIQVSNIFEKNQIDERETKSLLIAGKELKCDHFTVITQDYESTEIYDGKKIIFTPFWKWLLIDFK